MEKEFQDSIGRVIKERCGYCGNELIVDKEFHERLTLSKNEDRKLLDKEYGGFYVSRCCSFYCTSGCFSMFTED